MVVDLVIQATRILVFAAFVYASIVALVFWGVRRRKLNPFGALPRLVRRASSGILARVERRLVRSGGNPQDAPLWLVGIVVVGGLILLSLESWLIGAAMSLYYSVRAGPRALVSLFVNGVFSLLMGALLVRVIASWIGVSPYAKWMRPVMALTNWLLHPLRRIIPPIGMVDITPLVAWFFLWIARSFLLQVL
jgi:YggT family protein